jgi:hypothetical protein
VTIAEKVLPKIYFDEASGANLKKNYVVTGKPGGSTM